MKQMFSIIFFLLFSVATLEAQENRGDSFKQKLKEKKRRQAEAERKKKELNDALFAEFRQGLLSNDVKIREASLDSIIKMKGMKKDHLIIKSLEDDAYTIRLKVLDHFVQEKTKAHLSAISHVVTDNNVKVRLKIVDTVLAYTATNKFETSSLIQNLMEDKQSKVRMAVIKGVTALPEKSFKNSHLFDAIQSAFFDTDLKIREAAYAIINKFPIDTIHDYLESALADSQVKIRQQVQEIVGKLKGEKAHKLLLATLNDTNTNIRNRAVELLGERLDTSIIRLFDNHLLNEKNYKLRLKILEILAKKPSPLVVGIVSRSLRDPVVKVRRDAAEILQEIQRKSNRTRK